MTGADIRDTEQEGERDAPATLRRIVAGLDLSGRLICLVTLIVLFVALMANVILRYIFGKGWTGPMRSTPSCCPG